MYIVLQLANIGTLSFWQGFTVNNGWAHQYLAATFFDNSLYWVQSNRHLYP